MILIGAGMKTILSVILIAAMAGCGRPETPNVQSEEEELQLYCSLAQTEFAVGQKLLPPGVKIRNNTNADVDLIGPTNTVIECTLAQPDGTAVLMRIAMPTGRDPRRMPPRKLKAKETIELRADGIWYYNEQSGFEPYIFRQEGTYEFGCKYEKLNSNIITITVSSVYPGPGDIAQFSPDLPTESGGRDSLSAAAHFKDFKVERKDLEEVLHKWHRVSQDHWQHGYSHVALGDRTGTITLKDSTAVRWMVRPGGLATLTFQDGTMLYLAKELTPWKKTTVPAEEKMKIAYTFLLKKVERDSINSIASRNDKYLGLIQNIIQTNKLSLKVENYYNLEQGPDLCHYTKSTKRMVAVIDVTEINENKYYVSYYLGPEGGASKEIQIEKKNGEWAIANDDGMWNVK